MDMNRGRSEENVAMTYAEDLKEVAQENARNLANAVHDDPAGRNPPGVHPGDTDKQAELYGIERDHDAAQKAVNSLREPLRRMAIEVLAFAFCPTDGPAWAVIGYSPGKPINDDATMAQLKKEVEKAHLAASKPE